MDNKATTPKEETIKLGYACHFMADGRTICGRHLARQLVEDALKLLVPVHGFNVTAAWNEMWEMAAPVARSLDDEAIAGGKPGTVLTVQSEE